MGRNYSAGTAYNLPIAGMVTERVGWYSRCMHGAVQCSLHKHLRIGPRCREQIHWKMNRASFPNTQTFFQWCPWKYCFIKSRLFIEKRGWYSWIYFCSSVCCRRCTVFYCFPYQATITAPACATFPFRNKVMGKAMITWHALTTDALRSICTRILLLNSAASFAIRDLSKSPN